MRNYQKALLLSLVMTFGGFFGFFVGSVKAPDPLCTLIGYMEPEAKCTRMRVAGAEYQAKVTMPDTAELYCSIEKRQGLACRPIKDAPKPPQAAPPAAPAPTAEATGSAAPKGKK